MSKLFFPFKAIEKTIKKYSPDYKITADGEIAIQSPFMSDTTYDCHISVDKQCWHDWESGEGGPIETLIAKIADTTEAKATAILLKNSIGQKIEKFDPPKKNTEAVDANSIKLPPGIRTFSPDEKRNIASKKKALEFLKSKRIDYSIVKKYNLFWTSYSTVTVEEKIYNFSNRIIIPTYENSKLVYYQARDFTDKSVRYKNPPKQIQPKSIVLPFFDQIEKGKPLFISEGPWEAMHYSGTYMFGGTFSVQQINKIKWKEPEAILIIPDNDEPGRRNVIKNIKNIKELLNTPIYIVKWWNDFPGAKDPIDAGITANDLMDVSEIVEAGRNYELREKIQSFK